MVGDLNNATDVRHAAAEALLRLADPASAGPLQQIAAEYPEHSVRKVLVRAAAQTNGKPVTAMLE